MQACYDTQTASENVDADLGSEGGAFTLAFRAALSTNAFSVNNK